MKLATRISLFFLCTLAVVLLGVSISIYALVRTHLVHRFEGRCRAALETLIASVEFDPDGLEWESNIRHLEFEHAPGDGTMAWGVYKLGGQRIDGSQEISPPLLQAADLNPEPDLRIENLAWNHETWHIVSRIVRSTASEESAAAKTPTGQDAHNSEVTSGGVKRYPALVFAAGTPIDPVLQPLNSLAVALGGIAVGIWVAAALLGRYLCSKALFPLSRIAEAAGQISAADFSRRLPSPGTSDELDHLAIALNDLLDRLQISFEQQRRFAAEASHQLRTPLTAILGQLEVALRRERSVEEYLQTVQSAHQQAGLLKQIVETLLFLTRKSADSTQIQFDCLNVRQWLTVHLETWREHPRFADFHPEFACDDRLCINAQRVLMEQAIDNLLDNACKYSQAGSPIHVRVAAQDNQIRIEVSDCGCGISDRELPQVFNPFFRGHHVRSQSAVGFGLGLSVVKKVATFFDGRVEVESTIGCGSRFTISLPAIKQPTPQPAAMGI